MNYTNRPPYARRAGVISLDSEREKRAGPADEGTLASSWQAYCAERDYKDIAPKTREGYRRAMKLAISMLPPRPTEKDVDDWMYRLLEVNGLAPATINCYKRSVEAVLLSSVRRTHDHYLHDVFAVVKKIPEPPRQKRMPPEDAFFRALDACRDDFERLFVRLTCCVGLRVGEVMGLKKKGDLSGDVLTVTRQREHHMRKNRKPHQAKLDGETVRLFMVVANDTTPLHHNRRHLREWLFPWGEPAPALLMERIREQLGPQDADLYFPRKRVAWHGFRHLGATTVGRITGKQTDIQRFIGDSSQGMATCYNADVRGTTLFDAGAIGRELDKRRQMEMNMQGGAGMALAVAMAGSGAVKGSGGVGSTARTDHNHQSTAHGDNSVRVTQMLESVQPNNSQLQETIQ